MIIPHALAMTSRFPVWSQGQNTLHRSTWSSECPVWRGILATANTKSLQTFCFIHESLINCSFMSSFMLPKSFQKAGFTALSLGDLSQVNPSVTDWANNYVAPTICCAWHTGRLQSSVQGTHRTAFWDQMQPWVVAAPTKLTEFHLWLVPTLDQASNWSAAFRHRGSRHWYPCQRGSPPSLYPRINQDKEQEPKHIFLLLKDSFLCYWEVFSRRP